MEITPMLFNVFQRLIYEVAEGSDYIVQKIIEDHDLSKIVRFDLPQVKQWAYEAVFIAIRTNNPKSLEVLLANGFDPNVPEALYGMPPPLWEAIYMDNAELFRLVVNYGADLGERYGRFAATPLQAVMKMKDHRELTEFLLPMNGLPFVDVNAMDNENLTALHHAISAGADRAWTFRYLVERGACVITGNDPPLFMAMQLQSPELAEYLINRFGDSFQGKDFRGKNALHHAAMAPSDNCEVAMMLIRLGLDVNEKDDMNRTPLHIAAGARNHLMVKLLLDHGANVNAKTCAHVTPLMSAASVEGGSGRVANLLLRKGADVNWMSKDTSTAFIRACQMQNVDIVRALIEAGADQSIIINRKFSGLSFGVQNIILKNAAKIQASGQPINLVLQEHVDNRMELGDYFNSCMDELGQMKYIRIHEQKTMFDVLFATRSILLVYLRNPIFATALEQGLKFGNWATYFPEYGMELVEKCNKTQTQFKAICEIEDALNCILHTKLPDAVARLIVKQSNIYDLRNLLPDDMKTSSELFD